MRKLKIQKIILIFCMCIGLLPIQMVKAASNINVKEQDNVTITTINDNETGTDINQFDYHGKWTHESGTTAPYTNLYMNDGHYTARGEWSAGTEAQDNYFEMKFQGDYIELYGNREPGLGIFNVQIDNKDVGRIDLYHAGTKVYQQQIFRSEKLDSNKEHVIRVTLSGEKNVDATGINGYIDFAKVYQEHKTISKYTLEKDQIYQIPSVDLQTDDMNDVIWTIDNEEVATITNGLVSAIAPGKAIITATAPTDSCQIEINVIDKMDTTSGKYTLQTINDSVIGTGLNQFDYHGSWGTDSGISQLYNNDGHWSEQNSWVGGVAAARNNYYQMQFFGEKIKIFGNKEPVLGIYDIYIDDILMGTVDAYHENTKIYQQLIFESPVLKNEEHTLKVVMTGDKNPQAQRACGYVDFVQIISKNETVYPEALSIAETVLLETGVEKKININFTPYNTTEREVSWIIDNQDVVSIDVSNNTLTANAAGTANIQAVAINENGEQIMSNICEVTVKEANPYFHGTFGSTNKTYLQSDYDKIMQEEIVDTNEVQAWLGDRVYSEIVLLTKKDAYQDLQVSADDFVDEHGNTILSEYIKPEFLKYTKAANPSGTATTANTVMTPDIIYGDTMSLDANMVAPIWVTMNIPQDAKAGMYTGKINVVLNGETLISFTQHIEVLNLVQPSIQESDSFYLEMWNYINSSARYYNVPFLSQEHLNILLPHLEQYKENGGKTLMATIVEEPWAHQIYDDCPSLVKWKMEADNQTLSFDFTEFDIYANFVFTNNLADTISCYSILPWNNKIMYTNYSGEKIWVNPAVGSEQWTSLWTQFITAFTNHLDEKGWFDKIWIAMDERGRSEMNGAIKLIESIKNKDGKSFEMSGAFNTVISDVWDEMDHASPNISSALNYGISNFRKLADARKERGLITSIYTCTGNFPNMYNLSNPSEAAWTIWMGESLHADGFMRWAYDAWVKDPLNDASHSRFETGDVQMVYPGDKEDLTSGKIPIPRSTPRTERLYQAIRDIEKLRYLKKQEPSMANDIETFIESVKNFNNASRTDATRNAINAEMDRMSQGVINFSKMYFTGNHPDNFAPEGSVDGSSQDKSKNNLIDGDLRTVWSPDTSENDQSAIIKLKQLSDLSKIRIVCDKSNILDVFSVVIIDEKNREIPVEGFELVDNSQASEIEKQYSVYEVSYIGYAKSVKIIAKAGKSANIHEVMLFKQVNELDKSQMSVSASSQETIQEDGRASNILDGDTGTFWHSSYNGTPARPPFTVTLNLNGDYLLDTFSVLPRQSGNNGIITKYRLEASLNGTEYTTIVDNGVWDNDNTLKTVDMNATDVHYLRLTILEAHNNFGSIAEVYFMQHITPEIRNIQRAHRAVEIVTSSLTKSDYDKAVFYVSLLEDSAEKILLQKQLDVLVIPDDIIEAKNNLKISMDKAETLMNNEQFSQLSKEIQDLIYSAYQKAQEVYNNQEVTLDDCNIALKELNDALQKTETKVNKGHLKIALEEAGKISDEQLDKLVPIVVTKFKDALVKAEAVMLDQNATQIQVNEAFDYLSKMMHYLLFAKGDKTDLIKLINQIDKLDNTKYIENTWRAMEVVLIPAKLLVADENALKEDVFNMTEDLFRAYLGLRLKPNKDLLNDLINHTSNFNSANYTAETWALFNEAYEIAKNIYSDPNASEEAVLMAINKLKSAYNGLKEVDRPVIPIADNQVVKPREIIGLKTGDNINMMWVILSLLMSSMTIILLKRGKEY